MRDTTHGVKIHFLIEGDYPGDGKPKPVCFPSPAAAGVEAGRFRVLDLTHFLEQYDELGDAAQHPEDDY